MDNNPYRPPVVDERGKSRRAKGLWLILAIVEMAFGLAGLIFGALVTVDGLTRQPSPGSPMNGGAWIFGTLAGIQAAVLFLLGLALFRRIVWPQVILATPLVFALLAEIWRLILAVV